MRGRPKKLTGAATERIVSRHTTDVTAWLRAESAFRNEPMSSLVAELVDAAFRHVNPDFKPMPRADKVAVPPVKDMAPLETALDLFARGFSGAQIAARLRMPYATVMAEIGAQVDHEAVMLKAREVSQYWQRQPKPAAELKQKQKYAPPAEAVGEGVA